MTNVLKGLGWNEAATATEEGWVSKSGELLVASRNLLTNRVLQNLATDEEKTRWVDIKTTEIENKRKAVKAAKVTNTERLAAITEKYEKEVEELKGEGKVSIELEIQLLQKKLEYTKIAAEYEKAFAASDAELVKLDEKEDKIKSFVAELKKSMKESENKKDVVAPKKTPDVVVNAEVIKEVAPEEIEDADKVVTEDVILPTDKVLVSDAKEVKSDVVVKTEPKKDVKKDDKKKSTDNKKKK